MTCLPKIPPSWLTQRKLKELLFYDPKTGIFHYLKRPSIRGPKKAGDIAGGRNGKYHQITIWYHPYQAHRLAWLYVTGGWPEAEIDHIDGNGLNNAWNNLRAATRQQNRANSRKAVGKKSKLKGVSYNESLEKWRAMIMKDRQHFHLGYFTVEKDAHRAYKDAHVKFYGEFTPNEERMNHE